ncbi:MAG: ImmA/IrrE family metallo-endopeptidase [Desulfobacterales bacterium]|nr:ImmA/IrrE family metallo-endopeptidase [Desulfobacterales bacterium]
MDITDIPLYSYNDISEISWEIISKFGYQKITPIPIDDIVEVHLKIDVVHVVGLLDIIDVEGLAAPNLREIYLDKDIYKETPLRARYLLAHELGHKILHKKILEKYQYTNIRDWKSYYKRIEKNIYSLLETQANNFAELILVPRKQLEPLYRAQIARFKLAFDRFKKMNLTKEQYKDIFIDRVATTFGNSFQVYPSVIVSRIRKDELTDLIP